LRRLPKRCRVFLNGLLKGYHKLAGHCWWQNYPSSHAVGPSKRLHEVNGVFVGSVEHDDGRCEHTAANLIWNASGC
jgi:hypothetical protein